MAHSPLLIVATVVAASLLGGARLGAQQVDGLTALHRSGQTFLTWNEVAAADQRYRVYRASQPITAPADLGSADLLGEVDDASSVNARRAEAEEVSHWWVIDPVQGPLGDTTGLFVAITATSGDAWYAVTAVDPVTGEDTSVLAGQNATTGALAELVAPTAAVFQGLNLEGEVWAHWISDRDTPLQPAMSLTPSRGFNIQLTTGAAGGVQGLLMRLHGRNATYANAWPKRDDLPDDVSTVDLDDPMEDPSDESQNSHWFGYTDQWPAFAAPGDTIHLFTMRRVEWSLDWALDHLGAAIDPQRVHLSGTSMGGTGTWKVLSHLPDRFASAFAKNANATAHLLPPLHRFPNDEMWGDSAWNNLTPTGEGVWDLADAAWMSARDRALEWPVVQSLQGRQDIVIGWEQVPRIKNALQNDFRPARFYFDERTHGTHIFGNWMPFEDLLVTRLFEERLGIPQLAITDLDLDDDMGDGDPADGEPWGVVGAYADYDRATIQEGVDFVEIEVSLRDEGAADDAPADSGEGVLTPRRLTQWQAAPDDFALYRLTEGGTTVDEHLLRADEYGRFHTLPSPLSKTPRLARFEAWSPPAPPWTFVGDAPRPGDTLQAVLFGQTGEAWTLYWSLSLGTTSTAFGDLDLDQARVGATGSINAAGWSEVLAQVPDNPALSGRPLHLQATIGTTVANLVSITLQ